MNQTEDGRYQFTIEIDEDLQDLVLELNEDLTERAVMNLIHNAIQHNSGGCSIEIRLYKDKKHHVFLAVGDSGKVISKELLNRLNCSSYEWEPSSGQHDLGLKIVKQVADWHRWRITFSERKKGGLVPLNKYNICACLLLMQIYASSRVVSVGTSPSMRERPPVPEESY
jgi:signal transduction histidine kinase